MDCDYMKDFEAAYNAKKDDKGIYIMNDFCSNIDGKVGAEYIPNLLHLYYDRAITTEQNEFITVVIDGIVQKYPREAAKTIIENIKIFVKEQAEGCIFYLLLIFVYWNKEATKYFLEELKVADKGNREYFVKESQYYVNTDSKDSELKEFLECCYDN